MSKILQIFIVFIALVAMPVAAQQEARESLRDPTRPLSYTAVQTTGPELVLQAILQRQNGREAIVSGQRVRVGSTVEGARVEEIHRQSLVYSYQGQRQTLSLRPHVRQ